ncbi:TRAP transporter small permease [Zobellia galactanivorans]|uniref:TRAP transporter, small permease subunit n=1 Tax=Zobellia galactanivorans (strain DSM 12802 / CCUG 47099 / CIP 106680 / NCIMB 13871 / Dsij) TaxID=63186 RepID=G0LAX0_ZOBGA|nr:MULTISPECIES: TRAP transporter small permease [Zobellia]MBU3026833.1 TRAP transporter small permease [Zobellia galactanivorans]MDO6810903.1 TRAP transporter small permease [Zobellia galactanivorans]OWW26674.1 C4-dicarboxylate ABC transporter permease [Zobellia sp. OII3]CAZ95630.1 TRAP transporter, small permease subunit [Zobellia galactanivorans]
MELRKNIDKVLAYFLVTIMGVMVLNVLWQVFSRFLLGSPSSFTDELARYLMIWIGILGAAYVSGKNLHVAIDVLPKRFSERTQRKLQLVVHWLVILFSLGALVIGGSRLVYITHVLDQHSPALQVPLSVVYLVIPISGLLIIYYKISDLLND